MPVRSKALAGGALSSSADTLLYTCPADVTTVVRSLVVVNRNAAAKNVRVWHLTAGGTVIYWCGVTTIASEGVLELDSWRALEPGDTVKAFASGLSMTFGLYGAELAGVAP